MKTLFGILMLMVSLEGAHALDHISLTPELPAAADLDVPTAGDTSTTNFQGRTDGNVMELADNIFGVGSGASGQTSASILRGYGRPVPASTGRANR